MPYLEYEAQLRPLGPGVMTIGSGTESAWRIAGRDLAPLHAIVTVERDGRAHLMRGAPHAEIWVNGVELEGDRAVLDFGQSFRLGHAAEFTYRQRARPGQANEGYLRDIKRGRVYKLVGLAEIGRDPRCVVLVQDPEVSRVHAEVRREGDRFVARPRGEAYTLLNGVRLLGPHTLGEGDELSVGRTTLRFSTEAPSGGAAPVRQGVVDRDAAKMHTVFMGAVEARERVRHQELKRIVLIVAAVAAGMAVLVALVRWLIG